MGKVLNDLHSAADAGTTHLVGLPVCAGDVEVHHPRSELTGCELHSPTFKDDLPAAEGGGMAERSSL